MEYHHAKFDGFWNSILVPNLKLKHNINPVHSLREIALLKQRFPKQEALKGFVHLELPLTEYIHDAVVSLPISPVLSHNDVNQIIQIVNSY